MNATTAISRSNPFPGLRPFHEEEEYLFFGRESQVDAMVDKLAATRLLAVVGTSGSGKSSLVNCGLLPALHGGLMSAAGTAWRIAKFRPGGDPLHEMARALAARGVLFSDDRGGSQTLTDIVLANLQMSKLGLIDIVEQARLGEGVNLLVIVDQFEELFRYWQLRASDDEGGSRVREEANAFVNLLLEAAAQRGCPIYVALTMRSDFLGDCAQFPGLAEAINAGQYLVPRMSRDERRAAIRGPIGVGGAEISPLLLTRLVNDVGDNPDQLSILQHALNRTWAHWQNEGGDEGPLDLAHYEAIGSMAHALDRHADRAYEELTTERQREVCEKLFRALTDKATDLRGIRRPTTMSTLCALADATPDEVTEVIDVFRKPSRSFLMPPAGETLEAGTTIDISHESLLRVWRRLDAWADEERHSAWDYRRLAEAAERHAQGRASLWRDPDLQLALDWRDDDQPNETWAARYHPGFAAAMRFLELSREARDAERGEREAQRRRELDAEQEMQKAEVRAKSARRMRWAAVVSSALAVTAVVVGGFAYRAQVAASQNLAFANIERARFAAEKGDAIGVLHSLLRAYDAAPDGDPKRASALRLIGAWAHRPVETEGDGTNDPARAAEEATTCASFEQAISSVVFDPGGRLRQRLITKPYFVAAGPPEPRLVNTQDWGWQDRRSAEDCLADKTPGHDAPVPKAPDRDRMADWPPAGEYARVLAVSSPDRNRAVTADRDGGSVQLWDRSTNDPKTLDDVRAETAAFSPDGKQVVMDRGYGADIWDAGSGERLSDFIEVYLLGASLDGTRVLTSGLDSDQGDGSDSKWGNLSDSPQLWDAKTRTHLRSLDVTQVNKAAFSPDGARIVTVGGEPWNWKDFPPRVWNAETGVLIHTLVGKAGHRRITVDGAYSPNGTRIATTSEDGTVRVWDASSGLLVAILQISKAWSNEIVFSPDGTLALSTTRDFYARLSDVETGITVEDFKTQSDWSSRAAFSADGTRIAVEDGLEFDNPPTRVWRLRPPACADADWLRLSVEIHTGHAWDEAIQRIYKLPDEALAGKQKLLADRYNGKFCDAREWTDLTEEERAALRGPGQN